MNRNQATIATLAAAVAVMTACSGPAPNVQPGTNTPAESSPVAPAPVTPTTAAPTTAAPTPADLSATFGDTVTFTDGTKVKVTSGGFIKAGQQDEGAVDGRIAVLNLSVTAGREEIDAAMMGSARVTVGTAGSPAPQIRSRELTGEQLTNVPPGEMQTIRIGYGISAADAKDVRVEVPAPTSSDLPAIFEGAIT
jgi:hypothetical protein